MRDKNQLRMKHEELCGSNVHEQVWLECDRIFISARGIESLVGTETQNDVKKVAGTANYFTSKIKDMTLACPTCLN